MGALARVGEAWPGAARGRACRIGAVTGLIALVGCAPHPSPPPPPPPATVVSPDGVAPHAKLPPLPPQVRAVDRTHPGIPLAIRTDVDAAADFAPALAAFRASCPALQRRIDASGLTRPGDWAAPCAAAATATDPRAFFTTAFAATVVGDGHGLDTGYYEPDLAASLTPTPGFAVPIYRRPPDLVDLDLGQFDASLAGRHVRGRVAGATFVPYWDRGQIDDGALAGRGLELAWAADPYAAFFLEIQGSGRLRLPDGQVLRIGYDGQNGHAYTGIGKLLRDRGDLGPGQATMAGIIGWLRAHPAEAPAVLRANRSKVFFKRLAVSADQGPPGAMGVPLTARVSVAADPAFVPLGAPLWLATTVGGAPFVGVAVAQDSGGAIKGPNRLDLFWGSGDAAGDVAGGITATGGVTLLLPPAAAARLTAGLPAALRPDAAPPRP